MLTNAKTKAPETLRPVVIPTKQYGRPRPGETELWAQLDDTQLFQKVYLLGHLARLMQLAAESDEFGAHGGSFAFVAEYMRKEVEDITDDVTNLLLDNGIGPVRRDF